MPTHSDETLPDIGAGQAPAGVVGKGTAITRYVVVRELGAGAFGVVYEATDPELERRVAIKLFRELGSARSSERFRREARAIAQLQHPNVVAVHDVGEHAGRSFIAMELIEGVTLRRWLEAERRALREILDVFLQAGRGLAAAHAKGLVHRDFKPDNVLVGADGRVRVADFGLARAADTDDADDESEAAAGPGAGPLARVTHTGAVIGTPAFMAPEQLRGARSDARSDQFAFCLVLHLAVYRQAAFADGDLATLTADVLADRRRSPPPNAGVPDWLARVIDRGLAHDPAARFATMEALLIELGADRGRRRRRAIAAGAALAVLGLASGVALLARRRDTAPAPAALLDVRQRFVAPRADGLVVDAAEGVLWWSPDRVVVHHQAEGMEESLDAVAGAAFTGAAFAPDGAVIVSVAEPLAERWWLRRWDRSTGRTDELHQGDGRARVVGVAADGAALVLAIRADGATLWRLAGGVPQVVAELPAAKDLQYGSALSPDRRRLAVKVYGGPNVDSRIAVIELGSGQLRWRAAYPWIHGVGWRDERRLLFATGVHPAVVRELAVDDDGPPRTLLERDESWIYALAVQRGELWLLIGKDARAGRVIPLASGRPRELDARQLLIGYHGAALLALDAASRAVSEVSSARPVRSGIRFTRGEGIQDGTFTIAGELAIESQIEDDHGLCGTVGFGIADGKVLWRRTDCAPSVRCAGDVAPPCLQVELGGAPVADSLRWLDPASGRAGAPIAGIAEGAQLTDAALSFDGARLALLRSTTEIEVWELATRQHQRITLPTEVEVPDVAFTPGGGLVVAGSASAPDRGVVLFLDHGEWREIDSSATIWPYMVRVSPAGDEVAVRTFAVDVAVFSVALR